VGVFELLKDKAGQAADAVKLVVVAITVGMGAVILGAMKNNMASVSTNISNATLDKGAEAMRTFGNFIPIIAIVVVAVIILALVGRLRAGE